jgi:DNA repair protein RecO (recombination protein O)
VAELLDVLTADADPQPELFDVAHATVRRLSDWRGDESPLASILLRVEMTILRLVGHAPETQCCVECRGRLPQGGRTTFGLLAGGTLCPGCRGGRRAVASLSPAALAAMRGCGETMPAAATEARGVIAAYLAHLLGHPTRVAARLRPFRRRTS